MIGPVMMLCCVPDGYDIQTLPCAAGDGSCAESLCDLWDDLESQRLKDEVIQACLNGGRTAYLYDIDGNEYYTTVDGIRHYTRDEG